jgi:PAS domain S-box-containing protein
MSNIIIRLRPKSLRYQLVFGIGTILTVLLLTFNYITITQESEFLHEQGLRQATNRSKALATASEAWLLANDYVGLEEIAHNFAVYDDLDFLAIINMDGKILEHTDHSLVGQYIADEQRIAYLKQMIATDANPQDEKILLDTKGYIEIIRIIHDGNRHIGMVNLRINQASRQKNINDRIIKGLTFTLISLFVVILFSLFIANNLTQELIKLIKMMKKVRHGNKNVRADESPTREVALLSREFNSMINALNQSEKSYELLRERLELAFEGTQDGLWDWNIIEGTVYFSVIWKKMLGYEDNELANTFSGWQERVHPEDLDKATEDLQAHLEGKTKMYSNIHRLQHKNGHWIWNLARGKVIYDQDGKAVRMVGTNTDISELKRLEKALNDQEELMIAQSRHAAMGEMIAMIAHQWRQPITIIAMGANNILVDIELDNISEEALRLEANSIVEQAQYLSKTIDDFRNFFRPNKDKEEVMIQDVFAEAVGIIGKSLENDSITLSIKKNETGLTKTYSRELLQVFLNLLKNAKEALIEHTKDKRHIDVVIKSGQDTVTATICDNGGGIAEATMEKIFDPYFSTKNEKIGTGLGLYMSKTIIEKHLHGTISVISKDKTTCFTITIPKTSQEETTHE